MKKVLIFCTATSLALAVGCKKDEPDPSPKPAPTPVSNKEIPFEAKIINLDPAKLESTKAGDIVRFNIQINEDKIEGFPIYKVEPVFEDKKFHQEFGKDYQIYLDKDDKPFEGESINLLPGDNKIAIKPLTAGAFYIKLRITKFVEGNITDEVKHVEALINVAQISFWADRHQTDEKGMFDHSKHINQYKFKINDGDGPSDNFLSDPDYNYSYLVTYAGTDYTNTFVNNTEIHFVDSGKREVYPPALASDIVAKVVITKKHKKLDKTITFTYENIPMVKNYQ